MSPRGTILLQISLPLTGIGLRSVCFVISQLPIRIMILMRGDSLLQIRGESDIEPLGSAVDQHICVEHVHLLNLKWAG